MDRNNQSGCPVLVRYDPAHLALVALPLGGTGTGTVSLGGRGGLRDWEIVNRPAKGFAPHNSFLALQITRPGGKTIARALEGVLGPPYEGAHGSTVPNHGLPRFRSCSFAAAYPFGQLQLADPDVPVQVRIEAFNPLVPGDAERSGIPAAVMRFVLTNTTGDPLSAAVCGNVENFIGYDGKRGAAKGNRNSFRTATQPAPIQGVF